jgi:hypothetical protein
MERNVVSYHTKKTVRMVARMARLRTARKANGPASGSRANDTSTSSGPTIDPISTTEGEARVRHESL